MRWLSRLAALIIVIGVATIALRYGIDRLLQTPGSSGKPVTLLLPKGTGSQEMGRLLGNAGVIDHPLLWPLLVRWSGRPPLQAGEYEFPAAASPLMVIEMMRHGQVVVHRLTIAEGLTVRQILVILQHAEATSGSVSDPPAEGSLLPATYFYSYGEERMALLSRMQRDMQLLLDDQWARRIPDPFLPTRQAALTLASIVERETGLAEERPHIAAVFLNRLRLHMRLQSDPTVIYLLSHGEGVLDRPLSRADLLTVDPYNSYASDGLPPGPICNPGRASLMAVLHPAASDDLYFVADGSGGHVFAKSLAEHNQNVAHWRRLEQGLDAVPARRK
jgi:UPF0755 protein